MVRPWRRKTANQLTLQRRGHYSKEGVQQGPPNTKVMYSMVRPWSRKLPTNIVTIEKRTINSQVTAEKSTTKLSKKKRPDKATK